MLPVNIACAFENITFVKKVRKKSPEVLIQNLYEALNVIWYHFHSFLWLCIHIYLDHYWKYIHCHVNSTSTITWQVKNMFCNRKKIKYLITATLTTLLPWKKAFFSVFFLRKFSASIRFAYATGISATEISLESCDKYYYPKFQRKLILWLINTNIMQQDAKVRCIFVFLNFSPKLYQNISCW